MFTLTTSLPDENWCTSLLRKIRWNDYVICPRCQSNNIKKRMVFTDRTKSIFASNVKEDSMTKQVLYFIIHTYTIEGLVSGNVSILYTLAWMFNKRDIAWGSCTPYPRCYRFIRTVMEKISSSSSYAKLDGKIKGDEFYIKAGLKGRSYHMMR